MMKATNKICERRLTKGIPLVKIDSTCSFRLKPWGSSKEAPLKN